MGSELDSKDVVELLARYEQTIGELYKAYAERFSDYRAFWEGIAAEEARHARLLRNLVPEIKEGCIILKAEPAKLIEISELLSKVREQIHQCKNGDETIANAIDVALSIEGTLLENDLYEFLVGKNKLFATVVDVLAKDTSRHRKELKRICEALMKKH